MSSFVSNKKKSFILLSVFVLIMFIALFIYTPEEIINSIGIKNSYLLIGVIAFIGSYSPVGSIFLIFTLTSMVISGLNPFYLWIISSVNLAIGDTIFFQFGSKGRDLIKGRVDKKINNISQHFKEKKWLRKLTPFFSYLYIGLTPLPNDILLFFLASIKYPTKSTIILILLGDLTFKGVIIIAAFFGFNLI